VTFDGFKVQNAPETAILMWNSNNVNVKYYTVQNSMEGGIHAGGDNVGDAHHITIRNNTVNGMVRENVPGHNPSTWAQANNIVQRTGVGFVYYNSQYGGGIARTSTIRPSSRTIFSIRVAAGVMRGRRRWASGGVTGVGNVTSDPLLVSAGGWSATDYKLSSTSPLKPPARAHEY
jgi:hypothetical protein